MTEGKKKPKDTLQVPGLEPDKSAGLSPGKKRSPSPSPQSSARESGEPDGEAPAGKDGEDLRRSGTGSFRKKKGPTSPKPEGRKKAGDEEDSPKPEGWRAKRPNSAPDLAVSSGEESPMTMPRIKNSLSDSDLVASKNPRNGKSRVKWSDRVQVETLIVPTCPEHGPKFMEFLRGPVPDSSSTTSKAPSVEFSDIACWVKPSRALGARSVCKACNNQLGVIEKSDYVVVSEVRAHQARGLYFWDFKGCFGCELAT